MRLINLAVSTCLIAASAGCWSAPLNQDSIPEGLLSEGFGLSKSVSVAVLTNLVKPLNQDGTVIYFQNQGGGGPVVGLMLGPIGVVANGNAIEDITTAEADQIRGKVRLNPEAAFLNAASGENLKVRLNGESSDAKVTPYVVLSKISDDGSIRISAVLHFVGTSGSGKWTRRYQYELPYMYSLGELSLLPDAKSNEIQAVVVTAFSSLIKHIREEASTRIGEEKPVTFFSLYLTPRREAELKGSFVGNRDGLAWVRRTVGVFAIVPADIKFVER